MDVIWLIFLTAMGLCVGSFLNVVIWRLPRGESIVYPGSHCPKCGRAIKWYDNIPIASYLALGGKCRFCKVSISSRYPLIEASAGALVAGLYISLYMLDVRDDAGSFSETWPAFIAHALLLCGLLACTLVDIEMWLVPLEICWVVTAVGFISAAARPSAFVPGISSSTAAMSLAAVVGLIISLILLKLGVLLPSFLDAEERIERESPGEGGSTGKGRIKAVAVGKGQGVNPRREVLREVVFLAPAFLLAAGAFVVLDMSPSAHDAWASLTRPTAESQLPAHFSSFLAALFGYLIGGLWIWGMRILGTLAFGREAMGMGDVHILAAVGAVAGWIVPSIAFFVAPFFGLVWGLYLLIGRGQRELPYGPWLAAASVAVIFFHDGLISWLGPRMKPLVDLLGG